MAKRWQKNPENPWYNSIVEKSPRASKEARGLLVAGTICNTDRPEGASADNKAGRGLALIYAGSGIPAR